METTPKPPTGSFPDTLTPFRMFCQKVLPAVYDDSLSYYELLCKVTEYLNSTMKNVNILNDDIKESYSYINKLYKWIDEYFTNLDITEEINDKLDDMASSGQLQELVDNIFQVLTQSISQTNLEIKKLSNECVIKTGNEQVTWANLSQEVKDKLVSGSSPVLQPDSVNTSNIIDGAVKFSKLNDELRKSVNFKIIKAFTANQIGGYFAGETGETPEVRLINQWSRGIISVDGVNIKPLDTIVFSCANSTNTWGNVPQYLFVNSEGKIISKRTVDNEDYNYIPFIVSVPYNCSAIYFNTRVNFPYLSFGVVDTFNFVDSRYTVALTNLNPPVVYDKIIDDIYNWRSWGGTGLPYSSYAYKVTPGEKIHLKGSLPKNEQFNGGIFYADIPGDISTANIALGNATPFYSADYTEYDLDVTVPSGANWLVIVNNTGTQTVQHYSTGGATEQNYYPLKVVSSDNSVSASNLNNDNEIIFKRFGPNNLLMPSMFKVGDNSKTVSTDTFPSPYIVKAVSNANGDRSDDGFTGGNHGYNNDSTGAPTANMVSLKVLVDGKPLNSGQRQGNILEITTVNMIQATNTCLSTGGGRNVIKETVRYRFDGDILEVSNIIEPQEDVDILRYYGMQLASFTRADYSLFKNNEALYGPIEGSYIEDDEDFKCPYAWVANDGEMCLTMKMKPVGLGSYKWGTSPYIGVISNTKAYYCTIYEAKRFTTADKLYVSGKYILGTEPSL